MTLGPTRVLRYQKNPWSLHSYTVFIPMGFMLYDRYPEMKTEERFENWKRFMGLKSVPVGVSLRKYVCEKRTVTQSQLLIVYFEGR